LRHLFYLVLLPSLVISLGAFAADWTSVSDKEQISNRAKQFTGGLHAIGSTGTFVNCTHAVREPEGQAGKHGARFAS
jgi:hypothetical protein